LAGHPDPETGRYRPEIPEPGAVSFATKMLRVKVADGDAESVTVTVAMPAFPVFGTVKVTPTNDPWVDTAGEAGTVATVVDPILTDKMVLPAEKPLPAR
jgi:hypothetical protein